MTVLSEELAALVRAGIVSAQAAGALPAFELPPVEVRPSRHADQGDFNVAFMPLAKAARMAPLAIAQAVAGHLPEADYLATAVAAAPGYLNLTLNADWLRRQVDVIYAQGDAYGSTALGAGQRAQVEFVSANPTAPLHIGRSRGAIVGDTMARLLEAAGYEVEREYYFNNAGAQMRNLGNSLRLRYLEALGMPITLTEAEREMFYQGDYLKEFATRLVAEHGDAWAGYDYEPFKRYAEQQMFAMIRETLKRVNIHHDVFFNEDSLYTSGAIWRILEGLEAAGTIYRSVKPETNDDAGDPEAEAAGKGEATWFRSSAFGDSKDRVMVKSTGEPTYTLPDIAYHVDKLERGFAIAVNVLGADHYTQHQVVKYGLTALGYDPSRVRVILVQLVALMRGGEVVRMSSRKGNFETLDDLIDQTSADAVRYNLLARSADTHLNFDLDLAVKKTTENPVYYIQYAHVRCAGILREAAARGVSADGADLALLGEPELRFLRHAIDLSEVIALSSELLEPHRIAFYALELANAFHPMFDTVRVLSPDVPLDLAAARLRFYGAVQIVFRRVLSLMGMTAPDVM